MRRVPALRRGTIRSQAIDVEGPVLVEVFVLCDDQVVQGKLSEEWMSALAPYLPEPFRDLG